MDYYGDAGSPVRTLEVSDPNVRGKKIMVRIMPFSALFFALFLGYMAFVYSKDGSSWQMIYVLMMVFFVSSDIFFFLFYQSFLGRSYQKIIFYERGIQFPNYLWDRSRGRASFLEKGKIASVKASFITGPNVVGTNTAELVFRTIGGKTYRSGYRINSDIVSTSDWLEKEWQMKVERSDSRGNPMGTIYQSATPSGNNLRACIGCGYSFDDQLGFCPSCGKFVAQMKDPMDQFVPEKTPERARSPILQPPSPPNQNEQAHVPQPQPGANQYPQPSASLPYQSNMPPAQHQYYPPYQNQYGQVPQYPYDPRYQVPQPGQGYNPPQFPNPYCQTPYPQAQYPSGKNPKMARLLAALGFLGFMGLGHFYMGKLVKGIILLIIGVFFAMMSLISIITMFDASEYSLGARIITAATFTLPFMILMIWQLNDAPKQKRTEAGWDQYGNYRPPNGP